MKTWLRQVPIIADVKNYSKYLAFHTTEHVLLTHFKFTGWWYPGWEETPDQQWLHPVDTSHLERYARLALITNRGILWYTDPRALGSLWLFHKDRFWKESPHLTLGPPVTGPGFNFMIFRSRCKRSRSTAICDVLLDQSSFSGIGNYLRCEIMYFAQQNPFQVASTINENQIRCLYDAVKIIIHKAMESDDYSWWNVFRRKETQDGKPVVRKPHKGRGVYFCPSYQRDWT